MKKLILLIGPALFLIEELLLPGDSADPATLLDIIATNSAAWEIGHEIILVAFAFLALWLFSIVGVAPGIPTTG
jgi:hypothetical protein